MSAEETETGDELGDLQTPNQPELRAHPQGPQHPPPRTTTEESRIEADEKQEAVGGGDEGAHLQAPTQQQLLKDRAEKPR